MYSVPNGTITISSFSPGFLLSKSDFTWAKKSSDPGSESGAQKVQKTAVPVAIFAGAAVTSFSTTFSTIFSFSMIWVTIFSTGFSTIFSFSTIWVTTFSTATSCVTTFTTSFSGVGVG